MDNKTELFIFNQKMACSKEQFELSHGLFHHYFPLWDITLDNLLHPIRTFKVGRKCGQALKEMNINLAKSQVEINKFSSSRSE
jgi:hypothetical protein